MSRWQWGSLLVVLGCFLVMGIWDAIAIYHCGRKGSISYLMTVATYHAPIVAFIFGILAGHLFWPLSPYTDDATPRHVIEITVDAKGNILNRTERIVESLD